MPDPSIFTSVINSYLPEPHASLLNGILFGVNLKTSWQFYQQLKIVGLVHIVVLSGINITLIASIIGSLTSFFSRRVSSLITIFSIIIFVFFVGFKAPIVRAAIMGILTFVAIMYGRKNIVIFSLFLSGLISIIIWPTWISSISFQLSYAATLGIILFGVAPVSSTSKTRPSFKNFLWKELKPSLAAQLFTAPIIFIYFRQISLIAPVSNLLVAPTIGPLMIFGFLASILGKINFFLGIIPAYVCYGILSYVIFVIEILSELPFVFIQF